MNAQERRIEKLEAVMIDDDLDFEIRLLAACGMTREEVLAEYGTFHEFIKAVHVALEKLRELDEVNDE